MGQKEQFKSFLTNGGGGGGGGWWGGRGGLCVVTNLNFICARFLLLYS